jgi:hypothetical protein
VAVVNILGRCRIQPHYKNLLAPVVNSQARHNGWSRFGTDVLLVAGVEAMLSGCATIPLKRLQPVVAPPSVLCNRDQVRSFVSEPTEFHYVLPGGAPVKYILRSPTASGALFETYYITIQTSVRAKLPPGLQQHKVTITFTELLSSVTGEAQLDAQVADGTLTDSGQIEAEREAIRKHSAPSTLTHGETKDFAEKLFDLQLKPAADLTNSSVNESGLSAKEVEFLKIHPPLDKTFVAYFEAYYNGEFIDRMGTLLDKPQIPSTVPDSEIVAAETVLLEFLIDAIDPSPVMGDAATGSVNANTTFYPGNSKNEPTAYLTGVANYIQIPTDSNACGITTTNAWVLKDLANGASGQAATVGGLVANTPGGISLGLGVLGKISIGDNQTLSVMTAASRVALRVTLASSYWSLRHFRFNVTEP